MQVFGNFIQQFPPTQDSLELNFTPTSLPLKKRWRNNRLSAHFIADYFTTFLPLDDGKKEHQKRIKESQSAISYIANELLENAIKYNDEKVHSQIKFGVHFLEANTLTAVVFASNSISEENQNKLKNFISILSSQDPEMLYIQQLENNTLQDKDEECSGLGLLTMINDYNARLGWKFDVLTNIYSDSFYQVTTMVQIEV